jgi:zinc/manganese transport system permease protein
MSNAMPTSMIPTGTIPTGMIMASTMFAYDFMQNAFAAAGIVAVVCGLVGFFLVLRAQTFAGHALSHVGFAGATGAVLLGISPLWGLVALTLVAGIGMGLLGERLHQRDVAIGIVLAMSLGLGLLFLHFFTAYATQATALLFGNILGVDAATVWTLLLLGIAAVAALAAISRPLLFASLQPELAEAKGVSLRTVSVLFLAVVALAVAQCAQIVGVLLVFALMVGPAAAAQQITTRFWHGIALSVALALVEAWFGLVLAFVTDWPTSFWITALSGSIYLAAVLLGDLLPVSRKVAGSVVLVLAVAYAMPALAHAILDRASPPAGSEISGSPHEIVLTFTEGIEPLFSTVELRDARGGVMATTRPRTIQQNNRKLVVEIPALSSGTYTVIWHATSVDTHKTEGSYRFTVK